MMILLLVVAMALTPQESPVKRPLSDMNISNADDDQCLLICLSERRACLRWCNGDPTCADECSRQFDNCLNSCDYKPGEEESIK